MAKQKINWLLILQGWAMLWVVIGHSYLGKGEDPVWVNMFGKFAYSFHMQLFMLISGYLYYYTRLRCEDMAINCNYANAWWGYISLLYNKIQRLLLPGLVFSIVALLMKVLFPGEMARQVQINIWDVIHMYLYPNDNPMRELWFIAALFWLFVISPVWKISLKSGCAVITTTIILLFVYVLDLDIELLCIGRALNYSLYFYTGIILSKYQVVENIMMKNKILTFTAGLILYTTGTYLYPLITQSGGIIMSFAVALFADKFCPQLFKSFRNYTYQIFLMGIFAQMLVKIVYRHVHLPYIAGYIVCLLMGLYIPVVVSKIIEKTNLKPMLLFVGLKKKQN